MRSRRAARSATGARTSATPAPKATAKTRALSAVKRAESRARSNGWTTLAGSAPLVVDTRNAVKGRYPHVFRLGAPAVMRGVETRTSTEEAA